MIFGGDQAGRPRLGRALCPRVLMALVGIVITTLSACNLHSALA